MPILISFFCTLSFSKFNLNTFGKGNLKFHKYTRKFFSEQKLRFESLLEILHKHLIFLARCFFYLYIISRLITIFSKGFRIYVCLLKLLKRCIYTAESNMHFLQSLSKFFFNFENKFSQLIHFFYCENLFFVRYLQYEHSLV